MPPESGLFSIRKFLLNFSLRFAATRRVLTSGHYRRQMRITRIGRAANLLCGWRTDLCQPDIEEIKTGASCVVRVELVKDRKGQFCLG